MPMRTCRCWWISGGVVRAVPHDGAAFEKAAAAFEPRARFAKIDSDAEAALSARFGIRSIPTLILFQRGKEIARMSGALPQGELNRWIEHHLPAKVSVSG